MPGRRPPALCQPPFSAIRSRQHSRNGAFSGKLAAEPCPAGGIDCPGARVSRGNRHPISRPATENRDRRKFGGQAGRRDVGTGRGLSAHSRRSGVTVSDKVGFQAGAVASFRASDNRGAFEISARTAPHASRTLALILEENLRNSACTAAEGLTDFVRPSALRLVFAVTGQDTKSSAF